MYSRSRRWCFLMLDYLHTWDTRRDILTFSVLRRPQTSCRDELFSLKSLCVFAFAIVVLQHELIIVTVCITSLLNHQGRALLWELTCSFTCKSFSMRKCAPCTHFSFTCCCNKTVYIWSPCSIVNPRFNMRTENTSRLLHDQNENETQSAQRRRHVKACWVFFF